VFSMLTFVHLHNSILIVLLQRMYFTVHAYNLANFPCGYSYTIFVIFVCFF